MPDRVRKILGGRQVPGWLAALGFVLSLPALRFGLQTDDHVLSYVARFEAHPFSLFSASPENVARSRETGAFAWWSSPRLAIRLLRPLSSLSHFVEYRFWPHLPWAPHLVNGAIYAALIFVAARLYRRLLPDPSVAGLAALIFAIDEGHAAAVGWVASRNTLLSSIFALLALWVYTDAKRSPRSRSILCALSVALSLAAGEGGVMSLSYLIAYALVYGSGDVKERFRSLVPSLSVISAWAVYYFVNRCGIHGSSWYREFDAPFAALVQGILDLPIALLSLFGPSFTGVLATIPVAKARLVAFALVLPLFAGIVLWTPRSRVTAFFALGAALCLPPLFLTLPQDRLLVSMSFGGLGLVASLLSAPLPAMARLARGHRGVMFFFHLVFAPLMFMQALAGMALFENGARALAAALKKNPTREIVLVNSPNELLVLYAGATLQGPDPIGAGPTTHQLYAGFAPMTVERIDETTLEVAPEGGWGRIPFERVFGAPRDAPPAGAELEFSNLQVSVIETNAEHMPSRVRFHFATKLESPERTWLSWQGHTPQRWTPPPIGTKVSLPALNLFTSLNN